MFSQVIVIQEPEPEPCSAIGELVATLTDWRQCGDLAGHLRAWWQAIHTDPDQAIPYTPLEVR